MNSTTERIPILIAGAGNMGSSLAQHALANPKLLVNIFIRDASKHKDLIAQVEAKGGKAFIGDSEQVEVLEQATKGIHSVVNTLYPRGDEQKFVNGQKLLIDAAVKNGVKRYYPVEYGFEETPRFTQEDKKFFPVFAWEDAVQDYLKTKPIKSVIVRCGLWYFVFPFFFPGFSYYGDVNQKINFIDIDDVAKLMVGTLVDADFSGPVYFSGSRVSIDEAAKIYNKVRGTNLEAKRLGSIEELKAQAEAGFKDKDGDQRAKLMAGLNYLMFSGICYQERDDNERFGLKETTPIDEFFKKTEMK